jgi:hypothetical protein
MMAGVDGGVMMNHATRTTLERIDDRSESTDGAAAWIVLFAAVMVTLLTLFAGANLLGNRFDPAPVALASEPG